MKLLCVAQDRLDLAELTAKHLAHRTREHRKFDFIPLKRAARFFGKFRAALRFRRQEQVDKITVFVDNDFASDPFSRKSTTGLVAQSGSHTLKAGSTLQNLADPSVGVVKAKLDYP